MKLDLHLLRATLSVQSHSGQTQQAREFILRRLRAWGIPHVADALGNIYADKDDGSGRKPPCVVAHTDTVHKINPDVRVLRCGDTLLAWDTRARCQYGIGGDDLLGVALALQLLRDLPHCKGFFPVDEEVGGVGSGAADMAFFSDCLFLMQADRRGYGEFVTNAAGSPLSGKDFQLACAPAMSRWHFREEDFGGFTDVGVLAGRGLPCPAVNLACGYYAPHSHQEYVSIADAAGTLGFMHQLATTLTGPFSPPPAARPWGHRHYNRDHWYDDDWHYGGEGLKAAAAPTPSPHQRFLDHARLTRLSEYVMLTRNVKAEDIRFLSADDLAALRLRFDTFFPHSTANDHAARLDLKNYLPPEAFGDYVKKANSLINAKATPPEAPPGVATPASVPTLLGYLLGEWSCRAEDLAAADAARLVAMRLEYEARFGYGTLNFSIADALPGEKYDEYLELLWPDMFSTPGVATRKAPTFTEFIRLDWGFDPLELEADDLATCWQEYEAEWSAETIDDSHLVLSPSQHNAFITALFDSGGATPADTCYCAHGGGEDLFFDNTDSTWRCVHCNNPVNHLTA